MIQTFSDRLAQAVTDKDSCLVVGLDPVLDRLPPELVAAGQRVSDDPREQAAHAMRHFHAAVIEQIAPLACAVKPQIAFFEQWGPPGLEAYEHAIRTARDAGLLVIGDVKRGDIGSTASAYAAAHLGPESAAPADAITVNPYLGTDSIAPFLSVAREQERGLFVLVRTSNPSAGELQDLTAEGQPLHEHVARYVDLWGRDLMGACGLSSVGAVVGATAPRELARLRECMPHTWLLIPGVGAQGGTATDVAGAFDDRGLGAVVNSSRGILYAYGPSAGPRWHADVREAARSLRDELRRVVHGRQGVRRT